MGVKLSLLSQGNNTDGKCLERVLRRMFGLKTEEVTGDNL